MSSRSRRYVQEERQRRLLYLLVGAVLVVVLLIIGTGYYVGVVRPDQKPVLVVGSERFTVNDVAKRARAVKAESDPNSSTASVPQAIQSALDLLEREAIVRQGARELGIMASPEQVETQLYAMIGVPLSSDREYFIQRYRERLLQTGLSDAEYRRLAEAQMLQQLVSAHLIGRIAPVQPQVRLRVLQLNTEEAAKNALERLNEGLPMEFLAAAAGVGGTVDRGWIIRGQEDPAVEAVAFSLEEGQRSEIIRGENGLYYIIEVVEKAEERPVEQQQVLATQGTRLDRWVQQKRNELMITRDLDFDTTVRLVKKVQD